ncbi:unnamed protein product [Polarella glacialis]|uniref:Uncharacterized protein n=1 Tax=Polarella glacialis TaxID=89957 RepID=A0A813JFS7_POLGL|nr:unnamed protein product [Polarella glacialis]
MWEPHEAEDAAGPAPRQRAQENGHFLLKLIKGGASESALHHNEVGSGEVRHQRPEASPDRGAGCEAELGSWAADFSEGCWVNRDEFHIDLKQRRLGDAELRAGLTPRLRQDVHSKLVEYGVDRMALHVDLSENSLTADGMSALVDFLQSLNQGATTSLYVRTLRIYRNRLGDSGALQVARLLLLQPAPVHELHLSHNHISPSGASAILLAFGANPARVYPFLLPPRNALYGACWVRMEQNDISDADALLKAMESIPGVYVMATTQRSAGSWGPSRAPNWATTPDSAPQAVLHIFPHQAKGGIGKGSWVSTGEPSRLAVQQAAGVVQGASAAVRGLLANLGPSSGATRSERSAVGAQIIAGPGLPNQVPVRRQEQLAENWQEPWQEQWQERQERQDDGFASRPSAFGAKSHSVIDKVQARGGSPRLCQSSIVLWLTCCTYCLQHFPLGLVSAFSIVLRGFCCRTFSH